MDSLYKESETLETWRVLCVYSCEIAQGPGVELGTEVKIGTGNAKPALVSRHDDQIYLKGTY